MIDLPSMVARWSAAHHGEALSAERVVLAVALGTGWPHTPEQQGSIPWTATGSNARWEYIAL